MGAQKHIPTVSIIVPVRNEERNIVGCLQSLFEQGTDLEIMVADDGSQDGTAHMVRQLAARSRSVQLIPVPALPEGWVGKNHALHVGVQQARGEWLLFTDADTRHAPGKLAEVVGWAEQQGLDLVSFSPCQEVHTWWEKAVIPQVYRQLARLYPYKRVNAPADSTAAANGQYILIRREVYSALGGHQAIRDAILEDVELARRAKQSGYRLWFGPGAGIVSTRMYRSFAQMWEGWTKNLFLLYHRDQGAVRRAAAGLACRSFLPALAGALLLGPAPVVGWPLLAYVAWEHSYYWRGLPAGGRTLPTALLLPGAVLLFLLLLNSARRYVGGAGIEWKGRQYRAEA